MDGLSLQLLKLGTYARDATGDLARVGFIKINQMFAELFALAGRTGQQGIINVGSMANSVPPGTVSNVAFPLINQNFSVLFTAVGEPAFQQVILLGGEAGMVFGQNSRVIGTGDPSRVAGEKINANFSYLYAVL